MDYEHTIIFSQKEVRYRLRRSMRAKYLRISVLPDGILEVVLPVRVSVRHVEPFLREKEEWILGALRTYEQECISLPCLSGRDLVRIREYARSVIHARLEYFNSFYDFSYNRVFIKGAKSRWGSCSEDRNLNFNYRIIFLPDALRDYIIVHELCHLQQMNHSRHFWNLVAQQVPDYREKRRSLKRFVF